MITRGGGVKWEATVRMTRGVHHGDHKGITRGDDDDKGRGR